MIISVDYKMLLLLATKVVYLFALLFSSYTMHTQA